MSYYKGELGKTDKNKLCSILYYVAAACFYINSILNFTSSNGGMGATFLCLGSTFLCLGSIYLSKRKKDSNDNDKQGKDQ